MSFPSLPLSAATRAALQSMNITEPTPIQAKSLPLLLDGRDLIGQAKTGSGKTLAFAIPMVEKVDAQQKVLQALVLVPTRELAQQVGQVVETLAHGRRIHSTLIYGGRAMGPQITALQKGAQIVVGTPGRVLDLIRQGVFKTDRVSYVVLDEADEMLDRGFAPDVERILGFLPAERQTALFSATVPDWVKETSHKHLRQPEMVRIDMRPEDAPKIDHIIYDVDEGSKLGVLRVLLDQREEDESALVFGRTKHGVKKLAKQLVALGYPAAALQGNLSQNARDAVMADFRAKRVPILLATNVAARGLDVDHIGLVINYELPETTELLTHRVGRTGRMGREGDAVTLLAPSDADKWRRLSRELNGIRIPRKRWEGSVPSTPSAVNAIPLYEPRPPRSPKAERQEPRMAPQAQYAPKPERRQQQPAPQDAVLGRDGGRMSAAGDDRRRHEAPHRGDATRDARRPQNGAYRTNDGATTRGDARRPRTDEPRSAADRRPGSELPRRQTLPESVRKTGRTWKEDREILDQEPATHTPQPQAAEGDAQRRRRRRTRGPRRPEAAA